MVAKLTNEFYFNNFYFYFVNFYMCEKYKLPFQMSSFK